MKKVVNERSDEDFNSHVKNRMVALTKKDRDLEEQFDRNWIEITAERFKFNILEENAEFLKKCNKEGFKKFFEKHCKWS